MQNNTYLLSHLAHLFLECEIFQLKVVEKIKTQFYAQWRFIYKIAQLLEKVEKYCRGGQATDTVEVDRPQIL